MKPTYHHLSVACLLLCWGALALAGEEAIDASSSDGLALVARMIQKCGRVSELGTCLRMKAVTFLDRAIHGGPLVINDYLSLAPDESAQINSTRPITETEIEASLPKEKSEKLSALDEMISEKFSTLVKSRSLKFNIPTEDESNSIEQGRKKDKDKKGYGMVMMMMGGMMVQVALAKLAVLAGKALIVAKMALLLASVIGLKKLLSGGGGESHQVIYATAGHEGGGGHHDWGRAAAQDRAYSAHARTYGKRR